MGEVKKVSIIIPVYNTGNKLCRCLDSILAQSYQDYECIVVDDGSTDDSSTIIDEYAIRDTRFKVVHKENGGVSSARNYGLNIASGEWLVFIDSDDSLMPDHIASLMDAATDDVDLVMTGFRFMHPDKTTEHGYNIGKYIGIESIRKFISGTEFLRFQVPWDRTYRNKENLFFDEKLSLGEDRLFCYQYLLNCKGIATIGKITYIHDGTDETTLSYRTYPSSMNKHRLSVFKDAISDLNNHLEIGRKNTSLLDSYLDSIYTDLINSYYKEEKCIDFYMARILHKFNLL